MNIKNIQNMLTFSSQRLLMTFRHIIQITMKIIDKINNKKIVNTTDKVSLLSWTEFIALLLTDAITYNSSLYNLSQVINEESSCDEDEYLQSLASALINDLSKFYQVEWQLFVQNSCINQHLQIRGSSSRNFNMKENDEIDTEAQYLLAATQSLNGLFYKPSLPLPSSSSS